MSNLRWLDLLVVVVYMVGMVLIGLRFSGSQTSTESYFVAKRSIPGWAVGMSLFATLISSVTFIAFPGAAYGGDWSLLVPGMTMVVVLFFVGFVVIPFYRKVIGMSAYEYFGRRFGKGVRLYSAIAFSLGHFSKMGFIFYLLALTINSMTTWDVDQVIVIVGVVTVFYTVIGGLEAVIWTDVAQGFILWIGIFICLGYLLFLPQGGPSAVLGLAWANHKFSLGDLSLDLSKPTAIVLVLYGLFWYLQKYSADQTIVQRYLVTKSDREALRGVALGALLCIPVWTLFMLIGTCTWAFYRITGELLPSHIAKADQVFPHFLSTHIPAGLAGLFIASLLAAAMSTLASDLNCLAVVGVEDFYRLIKPQSTDRQRLRVGMMIVAFCGFLAIVIALLIVHTKGSALSMWYTVSAIVSGGLAGLFFLAFFSTRANKQGTWIGIIASVTFTAWSTLTLADKRVLDLGWLNFPFHDYMIGVLGHIVLLVVGYVGSLFFGAKRPQQQELTIWGRFLEESKAGEKGQLV